MSWQALAFFLFLYLSWNFTDSPPEQDSLGNVIKVVLARPLVMPSFKVYDPKPLPCPVPLLHLSEQAP